MKIEQFGVEIWMDDHENDCTYNTAETCVDSMSLKQLEEVAGVKSGELLNSIHDMRLSYGEIPGRTDLREGIAGLFQSVTVDNILTTNGAIGANFLTHYAIVEPGDEVVAVIPTYQQHYSIPKSLGADVKKLFLKKEHGFMPDLDELRSMVTDKTKLICINNPNNPTGSIMEEGYLKEIVEIARSVDAYILSDEVYRHLNHDGAYSPSIVDLYEKGISTGSMSKVFSLAGLRLGWLVAPKDIIAKAYDIRHYNMISVGRIDELAASFALKHKDKILNRNLKICRENLEIVNKWIEEEQHFHYVKPKAGTVTLLYYDMDMDSTELCKDILNETGVLFTPGDCFEMGRCVRIGYAYSQKELTEGLKELSKYLRKFD